MMIRLSTSGRIVITLSMFLSLVQQGTDTIQPIHDRTATATLSLEVNSNLALYTIQNCTNGIIISITPLCSGHICSPSHSLLVKDVFLPEECLTVPCNEHQLIIVTSVSDSISQYVIGVPSTESLLLLRFYYHIKSSIIELKEKSRVSKGILNCSPTAFACVDKVYYTLCVNSSENQFMVYVIDNIDNFQEVSFNPILDNFGILTLPVTDVSSMSGIADSDSNYILFVGGSVLSVINIDESIFDSTNFDACTEKIYRLSSRNTSEIDIVIPYLLYCERDYGVIDIRDIESSEPLQYDYNVTGYPVVCRNGDTVVGEVTIFVNTVNNTLQYNGKNFSIPGHQILPKTSLCFVTGENLFYVYSDRVLGTVLVSLHNGNFCMLFSEVCEWSHCVFRVVDDRYFFFFEQYNDTYIRLRLHDVLDRNFVSESALNYTASLTHLISLPSSPSNWLAIILGTVFGALLLLVVIIVILNIKKYRSRRAHDDNVQQHRPLVPQETDQLLSHGQQIQNVNSPALHVFPTTLTTSIPEAIHQRPPFTPLPFNTVAVSPGPDNNDSYLVPGAELPSVKTHD